MFCFFLLYLPIVTLVVYAFNSGQSVAIWEGFSFRWFESAWNNRAVQEASLRSIFIATFAATLALVLLGVVSLGRMPVTLLPDVTLPVLTIRTIYPNAAAEEVSRLVAEPIEQGFQRPHIVGGR